VAMPPGHQPAAMVVPRFFVRQRFTIMVNRYEILAANSDGTPAPMLAFAEQKRMRLKERVDFSPTSRERDGCSPSRRGSGSTSTPSTTCSTRTVARWLLQQAVGASLLWSTWNLHAPGIDAVGRERRPFSWLLRRFVGGAGCRTYRRETCSAAGGHRSRRLPLRGRRPAR
jgi:hypothetical protein